MVQALDPEKATALTPARQAMVEVAMSHAAQEVQAAMVIARRVPRDVNASLLGATRGAPH